MSVLPPVVAPRLRRATVSTASTAVQLGLLLTLSGAAILWAGQGPHQATVTLTLIYVAYAMAWNIVAGFAGQFTFGHAAFFGLGAYAATLLTNAFGVPPLLGMWAGAAVAALAAAAIGVITLRLRGLYFGLVTAVFPLVFSVFASYWGLQEVPVAYDPNAGLASFSPNDPRVLSAAALGAVLLVGAVSVALLRSRFGLFFGALRADQDAAEACGVATTRVKLFALALSAGLSAVAGALYASAALVVTPVDIFGVQMSVKPVLFSVFGGIGTLAGPAAGAMILVPLSETLTAQFGAELPGLSGLIYGGALLLVICLFPTGLVPVIGRAWAGWRARRRSVDANAWPEARSAAAPMRSSPIPLPTPAVAAVPILTVSAISKSFGGTKVLQAVQFEVGAGEILGVIGPNGAGKTTLFNIVNGFLRADAGMITLGGPGSRDISGARPFAVARAGLGRTFQNVRLFSTMTVLENVLVPALVRSRDPHRAAAAAWAALGETGLEARAHAPVGGLSTGELRRLELARAMATAGPGGLLLLDEFLGGLTATDGAVLLAALRRWRDLGGSVLAIEHTMRAMAGFVDRFVVLNFGEVIADGTPEQIWANRDVVRAYLGDKWVA